MLELFKKIIVSQFEASLTTLGLSVEACPAEMWNQPVARYPFCQTAFHTIFFTDLYLGRNEASLREQPFHREHPEFFRDYEQLEDREPVCLYDKPEILTYLRFCRAKVIETIAAETEATLAAHAEFDRRTFSRAELHLYNIRHIQHHAAQLILRLRLDSSVDIPWVGAGWKMAEHP
jgi:hypothetical protein